MDRAPAWRAAGVVARVGFGDDRTQRNQIASTDADVSHVTAKRSSEKDSRNGLSVSASGRSGYGCRGRRTQDRSSEDSRQVRAGSSALTASKRCAHELVGALALGSWLETSRLVTGRRRLPHWVTLVQSWRHGANAD